MAGRAALAAALVAGLGSPVVHAAAPKPTLEIVEPKVEGRWTGAGQLDVGPPLRRGLEGLEGFSMRNGRSSDCSDPSCWRAYAADHGVSHVLTVGVRVRDRDVDVRLEVYDGRSGRLVASGESSCDVCANVEVVELLTAAAEQMKPRLDALLEPSSTIVVDGSPRTAEVAVDGEVVGPVPYRGSVVPGEHEVVVTAAGHDPFRETAFVGLGEATEVDFSLTARGEAPVDRSGLGPKGITGAVAVGVGVGAVGAGVALLVLDGRPIESSCPDGVTDAAGRCPEMYGTRAGGITMTALGGAAVAAGVALLVLDRRARRVRVGVGPRGAMVVGRF